MDELISRKFPHHSRILITPLCWGMGHATRCLPIIRALKSKGHTIAIASDGEALTYLQHEEPDLETFTLPGYNIHYRYSSMVLNMLVQAPHILSTIKKEHHAIKDIYTTWKPDIIISDNRFGAFHSDCRNIFLTHQINLVVTNPLLGYPATLWNKRQIRKFDECWIPDYKDDQSLAGKLSHQHRLKNAEYIGPLSRLKKLDVLKKWDLICVLSGPEPQRSILEAALKKSLSNVPDKKILLVRGSLHPNISKDKIRNIEVMDFLAARDLNREVEASDQVLSRAGYSSIMDWAALGKRAILIPTPGQPEQEYLGTFHNSGRLFTSIPQQQIHTLPKYLNA